MAYERNVHIFAFSGIYVMCLVSLECRMFYARKEIKESKKVLVFGAWQLSCSFHCGLFIFSLSILKTSSAESWQRNHASWSSVPSAATALCFNRSESACYTRNLSLIYARQDRHHLHRLNLSSGSS